jgi:glycerol-3-phosphate dehydrogenase
MDSPPHAQLHDRSENPIHDLLIIGGGINGAAIARDAAGRGLSVLLVEKDDLASHTSSASTKLIHGGLRYLEHYEFRLVREALSERERLLGIAPHLIRPLHFVLPQPPGGRAGWLIRIGLFLYDHLGGRGTLERSKAVQLGGAGYGDGLKRGIGKGFVYSDCRVDDARLVALTARDAAERGADIRTHTAFVAARRDGAVWRATIRDSGGEQAVRARAIVNAAGPWVGQVLGLTEGVASERPPRLVKGSHIIVGRRFRGEHAYILQNPDGRIVFAIPYEQDFTLIGTTDVPFSADPQAPAIDAGETAYLCESVNRYFAAPIGPADVLHSFSGVRPLFDDGSDDASAVTRDYVLKLGCDEGPQYLSVFGGKITTCRRLAEHALSDLAPFLPPMGPAWTADAPLPGGDIEGGDFDGFVAGVLARWPFLPAAMALRMARAYGTRIDRIIGGARSIDDLGEDLGGGLHAAEVDYLVANEWARTADDILWRRTKIGLHTGAATRAKLEERIAGVTVRAKRV